MIEIRIHGRGGQGVVLASEILAEATHKAGKYAQSLATYSPERRGSPVQAFIRIDEKFINIRSQIYEPDCILILDRVLLEDTEDLIKGLKSGGWLIINADDIGKNLKLFTNYKVAIVDASRIAAKHNLITSSMPIVNTSILGAFSKATKILDLKPILEAIRESVPAKHEENVKAAQDAFKEVKFYGKKN